MPRFEVRDTKKPTLKEAQAFVGGLVQLIEFENGDQLLINEEGKLLSLEVNNEATKLWVDNYGPSDVIVGDALLLKGKARWT